MSKLAFYRENPHLIEAKKNNKNSQVAIVICEFISPNIIHAVMRSHDCMINPFDNKCYSDLVLNRFERKKIEGLAPRNSYFTKNINEKHIGYQICYDGDIQGIINELCLLTEMKITITLI